MGVDGLDARLPDGARWRVVGPVARAVLLLDGALWRIVGDDRRTFGDSRRADEDAVALLLPGDTLVVGRRLVAPLLLRRVVAAAD